MSCSEENGAEVQFSKKDQENKNIGIWELKSERWPWQDKSLEDLHVGMSAVIEQSWTVFLGQKLIALLLFMP